MKSEKDKTEQTAVAHEQQREDVQTSVDTAKKQEKKESVSQKVTAIPKAAAKPHKADKLPVGDTPKSTVPTAPPASLPQESIPREVRQSSDGQYASQARRPRQKPSDGKYRGNGRGQDQRQRDSRSSGRPYDQRANESRQYDQRPIQEQRAPQDIEDMSLIELNNYARRFGIVGASLMPKAALIEKIKYAQAHPDLEMEVEGILEKLPDGFGFLRSAEYDYVSGPDDVYVSPSQIRRFSLRTGDMVAGVIRKPKEGEKYFALLKIKTVNQADPTSMSDRPHFERLTPLYPDEKFDLEFDPEKISTRIMDLFTPVGKGQRGLIVAPPKVGKTLLLKELAQSISANNPDAYLIVLLIDERPEEVSDMKRSITSESAEVISSTFDEPAERHVQVAEVILEKAKRIVESGRDVVILLDSITRLARAYNTTAPASGKVLTGGIDAHALQWPKRFFGAARNMEEGGSLTIIATAMVDTGSRMDEVIYEEFKGTGNMEMHMTRKLSNRRIYPAFDLLMSSTRRDDLLHSPENLNKVWILQKFLSTMNTIEGMEFLIDKMRKFKTNDEFLDSINKKSSS